MKKYIKIAAIILILALSVVLADWIYFFLIPPKFGTPRRIRVPTGSNFRKISLLLEQGGVIRSSAKFDLLGRVTQKTTHIVAGEYQFDKSLPPLEVLKKLSAGDIITYKITIPEGYNIYQIARRLEEVGIAKKEEFIDAAFDRELLNSLGINGNSAEGYLFPDTYIFKPSVSERDLVRKMVERFFYVYSKKMRKRAKEIGLSRREAVTLASIIEKETSDPSERRVISAVFHNRLKKKMRLQSDPTVIYGIIDRFDGNLTKEDLKKKTPYNTYRVNGLPPGPIANPGLESLKATLYPADVDYLYFVSRNDGTHAFSSSLKEHNRAVWKYQKRR